MLTLLTALAPGCSAENAQPPKPAAKNPIFYLGGIQVNEPDAEHWVDRLEAQGMNAVEITHYIHQGDWDSENLWWEKENEGLMVELRAAKRRGLNVVFVLRLALDHAFARNAFLWHGMVMPTTEAQLDEWFRRYTEFATFWTDVARREGVDVLFIGSELNSMTSTRPLAALPALEEYFLDREKQEKRRAELLAHGERITERHLNLPHQEGFEKLDDYLDARLQTERSWAERLAHESADPQAALAKVNARRTLLERKWRELIARLRERFPGPLGYAANFDQYQDVGFWDALDLIGINAYFSLREEVYPYRNSHEIYRRLGEGWRKVLGEIQAVRRERGLLEKPVIFTELGYTYRANSTIQPWASTGFSLLPTGEEGTTELKVWQDEPIEPSERAMAVRALHAVVQEIDPELLAGLLYWKLSTVESHWEIEPFVVLIDEVIDDPILAELRRFRRREPAPP